MDVVCTYHMCNTLGTSVGNLCAHNEFEGAMFLLELPAESCIRIVLTSSSFGKGKKKKEGKREVEPVPHQSVKVYAPQVFLVELSPPELARFDRADSYHRHAT